MIECILRNLWKYKIEKTTRKKEEEKEVKEEEEEKECRQHYSTQTEKNIQAMETMEERNQHVFDLLCFFPF